jgi:hypothetical protein
MKLPLKPKENNGKLRRPRKQQKMQLLPPKMVLLMPLPLRLTLVENLLRSKLKTSRRQLLSRSSHWPRTKKV